MEVASPLPFSPTQVGTKRHLTFSPSLMDGSGALSDSGLMEDVVMQPTKRRRHNNHEPDGSLDNIQSLSSNPLFRGVGMASIGGHGTTGANKRVRIESQQYVDSGRVVQEQAKEIENLKLERVSLQTSLHSLKVDHDKVVNENRILKKAVTIQQERQVQAASEIEAAKRFKMNAEDRMLKLEQLVVTLRYHLQAQQSNCAPNDFMGFPPRPPDVY